ncbi:MAG: hypothetical protein V7L11_25300 [Nostoc sp.]|uniref:hypothetical protein n=1 Tax=Nostoc sp. TaxID=1180 RepID=UPI002FF6CB24
MITNSSETFLKDAVVERYNLSKLNKTRIRFKIQLKKTTKSNAPKWTDVLKYYQDEQESDLVKVTTSEVGLKGIKVFKALDEAANQLRQEIASVQEWMNYDNNVLENASVDAKKLDSQGRSQLQKKMDEICSKLLDEQCHLQRLASDQGMGLTKATAMSLKLR